MSVRLLVDLVEVEVIEVIIEMGVVVTGVVKVRVVETVVILIITIGMKTGIKAESGVGIEAGIVVGVEL